MFELVPPPNVNLSIFGLLDKKLKTYVIGGGNIASCLIEVLHNLNIPVHGVFMDAEYYTPGTFCGVNKYCLGNDLLKSKCNVVVGYNTTLWMAINKLNGHYGTIDHMCVIRPDVSCNEKESIPYEYLTSNLQRFENIYSLCADDISRKTLECYLNCKITRDPECLNSVYLPEQYFPQDILRLTPDEVFVDCGAYIGDTLLAFLKYCGGDYSGIFAFEPDLENYAQLQSLVLNKQLSNVTCYPLGVWSHEDTLIFANSNTQASRIISGKPVCDSDSIISINVNSIDNLIDPSVPVSFIKMDIEGSEIPALMGASRTISQHHPKLAICAYHLSDDIFTIPELILEIDPSYKIYFRHHGLVSRELVCYAL